MPSLDPALESVVTALVQGLRTLGVPFCIVGALVPELLLETRPESRTNDADVVVFVPDLAAYADVKRGLERKPYDFAQTAVPHRLTRRGGGLVDILPYSHGLAPEGVLRLEPGVAMNAAGFDRVIGAAIPVRLDSGLELPVVPLPLFVLLKLVAYSDRKLAKDLGGGAVSAQSRQAGVARRGYAVETTATERSAVASGYVKFPGILHEFGLAGARRAGTVDQGRNRRQSASRGGRSPRHWSGATSP